MTVVCWDGKYLAVDSRRTKDKVAVSDDSNKIDTSFKGVKFEGSYIRAVAKAGNVRTTRLLREALKTNPEVFTRGTFNAVGLKKGGLLIVTRKAAWHVGTNGKGVAESKKIDKGQTYAIGSGGRIGTFLMDAFGLSAPMAVASVTMQLDCCGGPVRYVKCRGVLPGSKLEIKSKNYIDYSSLRKDVLVRLKRKVDQALTDPPED